MQLWGCAQPSGSSIPAVLHRGSAPTDNPGCGADPGPKALPSRPPPDSWPERAAAAAPPRPSSAASLAPGQRRTVGMRTMLGEKRRRGEGAVLGHQGGDQPPVQQPPRPHPQLHRWFPQGPYPLINTCNHKRAAHRSRASPPAPQKAEGEHWVGAANRTQLPPRPARSSHLLPAGSTHS